MATKKSKEKKDEESNPFDVGFGNIFKGIGNFIDLIGEMSEKGEEIIQKTKEFKGKGPFKDLKGVYGFTIKTGIGGTPTVEHFGNVKATSKGPIIEEAREPLVDIFDEGSEIRVLIEMPGVTEQDVILDLKGDILIITSPNSKRKYKKEIILPSEVESKIISKSYINGIYEVRLKKK